MELTEILQWLGDDAHRRESLESIGMVNALANAIEWELHAIANAKDAEIARLKAELEEAKAKDEAMGKASAALRKELAGFRESEDRAAKGEA